MALFYPYYQIVTGFCTLLILLPLPWHWKAKNTGTLMYIGWVFTANLIFFANSTAWSHDIRNKAPYWCDLSAALQVAISVGICASTLCINRRLYRIASVSTVLISPRQKRIDLLVDLAIGILLPLIVTAMHVVVQGHRFNIYEGIGCFQTTYNVAPAYPLFYMWPAVVSLISIIYVILALRLFLKRRHSFEEFLSSSSSSGLNIDRYLRLMFFSSAELVVAFPLTIFQLLTNAVNIQMFPWISWEDTHYNFNRADLIPALFIERSPTMYISFTITLWSVPFTAIIFFVFFGLGRDQRHAYMNVVWWCLKPFGIKPPAPVRHDQVRWYHRMFGIQSTVSTTGATSTGAGSKMHNGGTDSLPTFIKPGQYQNGPISSLDKPSRRVRRDSLDSIDSEEYRGANPLSSQDVASLGGKRGGDTSSVEYDEKDGTSYTTGGSPGKTDLPKLPA